MAPFPLYDSSWVMDIEIKIKQMKESKEDYDKLPVVACKYCNCLDIRTDEDDNDICFKCGSINELTEFKDIFEYEKFINKNK